MARAEDTEVIDRFEQFYRDYYRNEIGELAQKYPNEQRSLYVDWNDLYRFDPDLADDLIAQPEQMSDYAEEALRLYDLPVDVKLGQAHVRVRNLPETTDIREIRADHRGNLISVQGIVRKATDVRPKITQAAFECQRCGTLTRIPQQSGDFQEPHECQSCERQGPFRINFDQSEFVDAQKIRVQESPEGLRGGETPQAIDVTIEDDITGAVTAGDHVRVTGVLKLDQQGGEQDQSPMFDVYMDGVDVEIEDEQFEEMDITDQDKRKIIALSEEEDLYERMVGAIAPSIYGYDEEKLAIVLQLFSGVTKHLPDETRIRGDLHILLIGDPGTGKCLKYDNKVVLADGTRQQIGDIVESRLDDPIPVDDGVYQPVDFGVRSLTVDGQITTRQATKVWKREAPKRMYRIRTAHGSELEVTPSHPLFVRSDGRFEPVRADELEPGDRLARYPTETQSNPRTTAVADGGSVTAAIDRIESIEPVEPDDEWVYDLEVEDTHAYVSNGVVSHNSQLLSYIQNIAPRSVYTSGKGSSSAGLTAAAVKDDFGDGQQWTLEAGALVLADQGIAGVDELDKMRCVTGEALVHFEDRVARIGEFAREAAESGSIEELPNGRTIRDVDATVWTMTDDGRLVTRPVTAVHEYDAPEELCRVSLGTGERITGTHDHPFFVLEDGERTERPAADLEPGDWVYVPRQLSQPATDGGGAATVDRTTQGRQHGDRDGKRLLEDVSRASRTTKAAFLRALADSEGTVDERTVRIVSSSYDLLLGAKQLLLEFGISSQIQTRQRDDRRDVSLLAVTDADSLVAFDRCIGFRLDRKQRALDRVVETATGDRTILDVVPDCDDHLASARESLRLSRSECGINDATYCHFETGKANVSFRLGRQILEAFEERKRTARDHAATLDDGVTWERLEQLRTTYHVSQRELAAGTEYRQQQVSTLWGEDEALKTTVRERLQSVVASVGETDLTRLQELVYGDVKWRRVDAVERVSPDRQTDLERLRREELATVLDCPVDDAVSRARDLLASDATIDDWQSLRETLADHKASLTAVAADLDVDQSTLSRWSRGIVATDRFGDVREAGREHVDEVRDTIRSLLDDIEAATSPKVYDLTVDKTHNFVANGMVVHNSEDRSAMHQALEQQEISISKAGINATLKSRCSLLGAANPKYGRFDQYEAISEQIDLEPALVSRFDLIFTVTDQPDADEDRNLAEHILKTNYAGELNTHKTELNTSDYSDEEVANVTEDVDPTIDPELLRKYVAYAKRNCYPTMTEAAREAIQEFYVDLRAKGQDEDAPVPVTARKLEALVRLAEASARVRLSDTVTAEDAERVIEIVRNQMEAIGVDPETGELDADVIESGTTKSQRDRIKNIKHLIADLEDEYDEGAPVDVVIERAEEAGMDATKTEHEIKKLKEKGEVYEPRTDHLRTT
ncbi:XRE family transcriptional regulator [Halobacteriales archaeon QH_10_67_22]|nr:MAG: XRE family transcriptional regulator [Halobacteriales archaeon QH_10_67_22]